MVWIPTGADILYAFTRPLNVKKTACPILQTFFDFDTNATQVLHSEEMNLVLPTALRPANVLSTPSLSLILFPNYEPGTVPAVERMSPAQTGMALVTALLNAGNLSDQGFSQIAHLARLARADRVRYSHFSQVETPLKALIGLD